MANKCEKETVMDCEKLILFVQERKCSDNTEAIDDRHSHDFKKMAFAQICCFTVVTNGGGGSSAVWGTHLECKERKASFLAPS